MFDLRTLLAILLLGGPVQAQDWTSGPTARTLETPRHAALMALVTGPETTLAPFTTDGCSGGLSEAWQVVANRFPDFAQTHESQPPWEGCCVTHDRTYHNAGLATDPTASFEARLAADTALKSCVISSGKDRIDGLAATYQVPPDQIEAAYQNIAHTMFIAVRFGGGPCSGLPWRWGYGYPSCSALTALFDKD